MQRMLLQAASCLALVACGSSPVVYAPGDLRHHDPTGQVQALAAMLPPEVSDVRLVFVHGVGDHCAGYALDPGTGWFKDKTVAAIGLQPQGSPSAAHRIPAQFFRRGGPDDRSYMEYETRSFKFQLPGRPSPIDVEAIEITWSHLTQWIKTDQLGYDMTVSFADDHIPSCVLPPGPNVPDLKPPPQRLAGNRILKEALMDRTLSDAVIYGGPYGETMERGVAETLCRAVSHQQQDDLAHCTWPAPDGLQRRTFFVTHSLGSRLLYDTFLDLTGFHAGPKPAPFSRQEIDAADPFLRRMLATTPAIYMMANQWSLLGLADTPPDFVTTDTGPQPLLTTPAYSPKIAPGPFPESGHARRQCRYPLAAVGELRSQAITEKSLAVEPDWRVVSFNDTNDLLTWHVPAWYVQSKGGGDAACRPDIELADVFVQNATHWLIIESPGSAHDDYFVDPQVWQVMRCGAKNGKVTDCP